MPIDLSNWEQLNATLQAAQQAANVGRIPGAAGLEGASSDVIASLLNPPAMFTDVSRQAAEVGAGRGIGGSAAAYSTAVRMTDEERLKRMALGQQMLTAAYQRNPAADISGQVALDTTITPYQQAQLDLQRRAQDLARERWEWERERLSQPSVTYSSPDQFWGRTRQPTAAEPVGSAGVGRGGAGGAAGSGVTAPPADTAGASADYLTALHEWPYGTDVYDVGGGYLPLYPGGSPVGGSEYDYVATEGGGMDYVTDPWYTDPESFLFAGMEDTSDLGWLDIGSYGDVGSYDTGGDYGWAEGYM